ncbi:uncharacterized membrane protein HdeD (DUF308 family) [Novosphingobium sp. PhB165]|uniref:HdeD family acid-resistance protein n=1 Tax=Novosphingobium sp. PhB165 TaxID=2485105 RepID=UPI0010537E04|nr:DUF308 domain-containing protein [Novosphingobium sp. PhB165]TCM21418.1 uncharacterized membrane protein HdeD (DUF308 family) [Novosphingobium sp. PhB165]
MTTSHTDPNAFTDPLAPPFLGSPPLGWGWVLAYGVLLILVAVVVIANPLVASFATGFLLGIVLCVYGVAAIAAGVHSMSRRARWTEILLGAIGLIAGLYVLFNPVAGALTVVWAIGAWLLISGGFEIAFALKARHDKAWRLFLGALDVVLGVLLLTSNPRTAIGFLAIMVAISFFMRGIFMIAVALGLRRLGKAVG